MTDAIDTLLLAADKKSEAQPAAIGQPLSTTADLDAPQSSQQGCTRSEQPEHPAPKAKHMPLPIPNKSTGAKKGAPALSAPMLPIPTERHLPSYKKPNAALTFPEKVRFLFHRRPALQHRACSAGSNPRREETSQKSTKFGYHIYH